MLVIKQCDKFLVYKDIKELMISRDNTTITIFIRGVSVITMNISNALDVYNYIFTSIIEGKYVYLNITPEIIDKNKRLNEKDLSNFKASYGHLYHEVF